MTLNIGFVTNWLLTSSLTFNSESLKLGPNLYTMFRPPSHSGGTLSPEAKKEKEKTVKPFGEPVGLLYKTNCKNCRIEQTVS